MSVPLQCLPLVYTCENPTQTLVHFLLTFSFFFYLFPNNQSDTIPDRNRSIPVGNVSHLWLS